MSSIKFDVYYSAPAEKVWLALTDPALLEKWLMPNNFRPELGAEFEFRAKPFGGWDGVARCKVIEIEPSRRLAYTWRNNMIDTVVRYELFPHEGGTRVQFEQSGYAGAKGFMAKLFMGGGWKTMLRKAVPDILAEL